MPTITSQIETIETNLKEYRSQLDSLNEKLSNEEHTMEQRKKFREDVRHISAEVEQYERELKSLRKENFKTMLTSVIIFALCIIVYMLYSTYHESQ